MEARSVDADTIFRVFTACPNDIRTLILDVRNNKDFKKLHISQAYSIRLSTNGRVLADYSQSSYDVKWSQDCWWGKNVVVYGEHGLKRDHPVIDFLTKEGKCHSLGYYKEGFEVLEKKFPFLCTSSVKANSIKKYPSQIVPGFLYLGDWSHAENLERLEELGIKRIITIHNHPENLKPPTYMKHLRLALPDVETADISVHFNPAYEFLEEGRVRGQATLVHCGAGVSRSACLCMMYLMRSNRWSAQRALDYCKERRSLVCVNDGFWRTLCALEGTLGLAERSDPTATSGFKGVDAPAELSEDAAGQRVQVVMLSSHEVSKRAASEEQEGPGSKRLRTEGNTGGFKVVFQVSKPDGTVGQLELGPMKSHQQVLFGRLPSCDVVLEHQSISRQHAQITVDGQGGLLVKDLNSGHGTKVDDVWIKPNLARALQTGSRVQFGASTRTYKLLNVIKT